MGTDTNTEIRFEFELPEVTENFDKDEFVNWLNEYSLKMIGDIEKCQHISYEATCFNVGTILTMRDAILKKLGE